MTTSPTPADDPAPLEWQLFESAPDALIVVGRDGVILRANCRVETLFGYERAALIGEPIEKLIPADSRQIHRAHRLRYIAEPVVRPMGVAGELWGLRADDAEFPIEVSLSPCVVDREHLVIATVRDITARRAAEESTRNLLRMLEGITEAVFLIEPESLNFTYGNSAASALTGYTASELVEMTPMHIAPDLDEPAARAVIEPLVDRTRSSVTVATTLRPRDGADVTVEVDISMPDGLRGQPPALVAIARNITTRLALEAETKRAHALRVLLDDRQRIARDLHDTVIQTLFASGLELQGLTEHLPAAVRAQAIDIVDRLDDTIRQLRATIFGLSSQSVEPSLLIQIHGMLDDMSRVLKLRPVLRTTGAIDTVATPQLAEHLLPTLQESLSNIARHARATRVEIELALKGDLAVLTVADNGIGIAADHPCGNGLRNMAERAETLGGEFSIHANTPTGTILTWSGHAAPPS